MAKKQLSARRFFTTTEIADYCAVTNDGVVRWIKAGKLRAFTTPGGHFRISAEDFRGFLERFRMPIDEEFFVPMPRVRSVVVVDDDPVVRDLVRRMVVRIDPRLQVEEAADGYEAGIKIGVLLPELVIVDLMMPGVDGISLCRSIRRNPATRGLKILVISGVADAARLQEAVRAGADACMPKPIGFDQLRDAVLMLLPADSHEGLPRQGGSVA